MGQHKNKKREVTVCPNYKVLKKVVCAIHNAKAVRLYSLNNLEKVKWLDHER